MKPASFLLSLDLQFSSIKLHAIVLSLSVKRVQLLLQVCNITKILYFLWDFHIVCIASKSGYLGSLGLIWDDHEKQQSQNSSLWNAAHYSGFLWGGSISHYCQTYLSESHVTTKFSSYAMTHFTKNFCKVKVYYIHIRVRTDSSYLAESHTGYHTASCCLQEIRLVSLWQSVPWLCWCV